MNSVLMKPVLFVASVFLFCSTSAGQVLIAEGGIQHPLERVVAGANCAEASQNLPNWEVGEYFFFYTWISGPTVTRKAVQIKTDGNGQEVEEGEEGEEQEWWEVTVGPGNITVVLDQRIEMPSWSGYANAPESCQKVWDAFYAAVLAHEIGHRDIGELYATKLRNALKNVTATARAKNRNDAIRAARALLRTKLDETFKQVMVEHRAAQTIYHDFVGEVTEFKLCDQHK